MKRFALVGIVLIGGPTIGIPGALSLIVCFAIGSAEWIERVGQPRKRT